MRWSQENWEAWKRREANRSLSESIATIESVCAIEQARGRVVDTTERGGGGDGSPPFAIAGKPADRAPPLYPLVALCRAAGLAEPIPEYRFHPVRKWRADCCWPHTAPKVIVEIDGGVWSQGRHTRGAGFIEDQRKLNAAALLGYCVLRYTPDRLGECIADLRQLFQERAK